MCPCQAIYCRGKNLFLLHMQKRWERLFFISLMWMKAWISRQTAVAVAAVIKRPPLFPKPPQGLKKLWCLDILCRQYLIMFFIIFSGNPLLHSSVALEKLGGWQDIGPQNGSRSGDHLGGWKETKEEITSWLPVCKSKKPQLLGLQIFLLRVPCIAQCPR